MSLTDLVSLLLSGVALVVSGVSLYLVSLKRADVELDHVPSGDWLEGGGMRSLPGNASLLPVARFRVCVFVSNAVRAAA